MTLEEALKVTTIRADELDRVNVKALREIYENDKANKYSFAFEADRKRHLEAYETLLDYFESKGR